jgi:hypothetical protein
MPTKQKQECQLPERKTPFIWLDLQIDEWNLTDAEVRLYVHIARRCGRGGRFWESREAAAQRLGWCLRKYHDVIHSLKEKGLIEEIDAPKNVHHRLKAYSLTDPECWKKETREVMVQKNACSDPLYGAQECTIEPAYGASQCTIEPAYGASQCTIAGTLDELDPKKEKDPKKRKGSGNPPPSKKSGRSVKGKAQPQQHATDVVELARDWADWAKDRVRGLSIDINAWVMAIAEVKDKKGITTQQLEGVFWFIKQDSFWSGNAISPIGLMKKSKSNGLPKIDNILSSMRNSKEVQREALLADCDFSIQF